ncbi:hypothetical protein LUZ60_011235 [Juncus effusus]|nr:hypothetical protein LUZ60_011235 [Juncus effusus]
MASISFSFILLLSLSISTLATSPVKLGSNSLRKACKKSPEPKLCVENLSKFSKSETADVHELTFLSVRATTHWANEISLLIREQMDKSNDNTPVQLQQCLMDCSQAMSDAFSSLQFLSDVVNARNISDINIYVSETYADASTCNNSCKLGDDKVSKLITKMTDKIIKLGNVTLALAKLDEKKN